MQIGDYIIFPSGGAAVALVYIFISTAIGVLSWFFYLFRVGGARLAKKQFQTDHPGMRIAKSKSFRLGNYNYVEFRLKTGESVFYRIAREQEMAWEVSNPNVAQSRL